jgi:hypothetical protein
MVAVFDGIRTRLCSKLWQGVIGVALCTSLSSWAVPILAQAPAKTKIPELASASFAWLSVGGFLDPPPGSGHGPIKQDPDIAFNGNNQGPGLVTPPMGNYKDPVLKPWAAAQMRASNEEYLEGKRGLPFTRDGATPAVSPANCYTQQSHSTSSRRRKKFG